MAEDLDKPLLDRDTFDRNGIDLVRDYLYSNSWIVLWQKGFDG